MSLPERMDDLARLTGIPQLGDRISTGTQRRRRLRWLPIILLLLVSGGTALIFASPDRWWPGYGVLMLGNVIGGWLPMYGPVKPWGALDGADERERQVRQNAYFVTFATISIVAVLGLWLLAGLALVNDWKSDTLALDMAALSLFLLSLWEIIPTLHASWATRPLEDE